MKMVANMWVWIVIRKEAIVKDLEDEGYLVKITDHSIMLVYTIV